MQFNLVHILLLLLCGLSALALFLARLLARERGKLKALNGLVSIITETAGSYCWEWDVSTGCFSLFPQGTSVFGKDIQTYGDLAALMHPDDVNAFKKAMDRFREPEASESAQSVEFRMQSVHGRWIWFVARKSAAERAADKAVTIRGVMQNIDAYKTLMEAMRSSQMRIAAIFNSAPGSMAVTDKNGRIVEANHAFYDMLGYSADQLQGVPIMSLSGVSSAPCGQDSDQESGAVMECALKKFEGRSYLEEEFVRSSGQRITLDYGLAAIFDFDGNIINYIFSGIDITLQNERAAELKLLTEKRRVHAQQLEQLHTVTHALLRSQRLEDLLEGMMGYLKDVVPGSACSIYLYSAAGQESEKLKRLAWYAKEGIPVPDSAQVLTAITRGTPLAETGENGLETRRILPIAFQKRNIGAVDLYKPSGITPEELKVYQLLVDYMSSFWMLYSLMSEREAEAFHDSLTGIWNRRYMARRLQEENDRVVRYGGNACLVIGDLGDFKHVNDNYGHGKGDEVLIKTADAIRKNLRISDCVGRYGGDEFIILLPNVTEKDARLIVERIKQELSQIDIRGNDSDPNSRRILVTIDFGLAFFPGGAATLTDTIALADEAMYASKADRKNAPILNIKEGE